MIGFHKQNCPMPRCLFRLAASLVSLACAVPIVQPGPGGMNLPKGLGMGKNPLGQGPPWRKAIDKVFTDACGNNRGAPSVFCFPDDKDMVAALQVEQYGIDMTGETFLMDLHVVIEQLVAWPPAWAIVPEVLSTKQVWTKPFCDKLIGSPWWKPGPVIRKSFITPRQTLVQVEKDSPHLAKGMNRWFAQLKSSGDSATQKLLADFKSTDVADSKNKTVHARPMIRLMMYRHAKMLEHILLRACKGSKPARAKFEQRDMNGLTLLHHAASLGDTPTAKVLLKAVAKSNRSQFAMIRDNWGYTAEDWANLGDFKDTAEAIRSFVKSETASDPDELRAPEEPVKKFRQAGAESGAEQCQANGDGACIAPTDGGWKPPNPSAIPASWLPPADGPSCDFDTIDVGQFDHEVFMHHYVMHPRPLLIRGGAKFPANVSRSFTRSGLLEAAGDHKIRAERFPDNKLYDGTKPKEMQLKDYIEFIDERTEQNAAKKLQYAFFRLPKEELVLNFSATLPAMLAGKIDQLGTQFAVGGVLMGAPFHHHPPAINSLVYGKKLWFFEPAGREIIVHEAMYDYLVRTDGAPGSLRCLQEAGDVIFIPRSWSHGTICLGDCVAASHEFSHSKWDLRD